MSFKSFLSAVGNDFKKVFSWLGSPAGQTTVATVEGAATSVVSLINPAAGVALTGIENLINAGLKQVVSIESVAAAAGAQSGSGPQKLAAVVTAIAPSVEAFLQSIGISTPTAQETQTYATTIANGLVGILNAIPAPTTAPVPAPPAA